MEAEHVSEQRPPPKRVNGHMWLPGESGNAAGRPVGARGRFSQRFIADLTTAWEQYGEQALARTAVEYPDRFVGICTHLMPKDVSVSLTAGLPGSLSAEDWSIMLDVLSAVRTALPSANERPPGAVLQLVLDAVRAQSAPLLEGVRNNPPEN